MYNVIYTYVIKENNVYNINNILYTYIYILSLIYSL